MKNILYIPHGSQDFCDDSVFCGLRFFLDKFNIYYKLSGCEFYPEVEATVEKRQSVSNYLFKDDWLKTVKELKPYNSEIKYDLIILGSVWGQNIETFNNVKGTLNDGGKIVAINGCDDNLIRPISINYDYIFYTNSVNPDWNDGNIIPFCCPLDLLNDNCDVIDKTLNCQMGPTHSSRIITVNNVYDICNKLGILDKSNISLHKTVDWNDVTKSTNHVGHSVFTPLNMWWDILKKSKIIISERGAGKETYRFWEALATGNIVLSSKNTNYIENNIPLPPNAVFWDGYNDLYDKIKYYYEIDDVTIINNRRKNKEFLLETHTPKNRVHKILKNINFI